jgi:cytochrome c oxidase assembly protein subunit 15
MRQLGWIALACVIVQGVLGGMTVRYMLPKPVSISHACLAQLFFSLTVAIAIFTSPSWRSGPRPVMDSGWPSMRSIAVVVPVLVLIQLALGAGYRHRAFSVLPHIFGAIVVVSVILIAGIFVLAQFGSHTTLRRTGIVLLTVTFVQVLLGVAAYLARLSSLDSPVPVLNTVLLTVFHVATGALTMAASVALAIQVLRNVRPRTAVASGRVPAIP